jgi:hypothetical protein
LRRGLVHVFPFQQFYLQLTACDLRSMAAGVLEFLDYAG